MSSGLSREERLLIADRAVADICRRMGLVIKAVPVFTEDGRVSAKNVWVDVETEEQPPAEIVPPK